MGADQLWSAAAPGCARLSQARAPALHSLLLGLFLCRSLLRKSKLKLRHPHFFAAEFYAFHFQSKALVQAAFTGDRDAPSGSHHAVPGKTVRLAQCADHKARAAGNTGGTGDGPIAGDVSARDRQDGRADTLKIGVWLLRFSHHHILNRAGTSRRARTQKLVVVEFRRQAHRWRDDVQKSRLIAGRDDVCLAPRHAQKRRMSGTPLRPAIPAQPAQRPRVSGTRQANR